jgi:hypothetical protein
MAAEPAGAAMPERASRSVCGSRLPGAFGEHSITHPTAPVSSCPVRVGSAPHRDTQTGGSMGFFSTILEKLGLKSAHAQPAAAPPPAAAAPQPAAPAAPPAPTPIAIVDVVAKLEKLAAANPQKLNWKTSIVDLLKLLDIDSSFAARKELATELGCPDNLMGDSAQMNMWLHKTVLKKIADNGGNVPKELLE